MSEGAASTALSNAAAAAGKDAGTEAKTETVEAKQDDVKSEGGAKGGEQAEKTSAEVAALFTDVKQLKLEGGLKLDDAQMKDFLPLAGELKLTTAQAQKLVEFSAKTAAAREKVTADTRDTAAKAAHEALKSDKDIGGANFDKSMALAGKALTAIGSPELNEALVSMRLEDGSMLGDSLVMAKVLVNLGKRLSEDSFAGGVNGGSKKTPANDPTALAKALYPNSPGLKT